MSLKVVGAGLGRTGTHSLKIALEILLGAPCHHMVEVFAHPEQVPAWQAAAEGKDVDWHGLLANYAAAVDWPSSAYYKELADAFPDALVLLSTRSKESWWKSASSTIFAGISNPQARAKFNPEWLTMVQTMMKNRFVSDLTDAEACMAAFERHNEEVKQTIPANRLLVWTATDGWGPICEALKLPVPDQPFPLTNTTEQFLANQGPPPSVRTE